jgi:hypothetical protein
MVEGQDVTRTLQLYNEYFGGEENREAREDFMNPGRMLIFAEKTED